MKRRVNTGLGWGLLLAVAVSRPLALWAANVHLGVSIAKLATHALLLLAIGAVLSWVAWRLGLPFLPAALCASIVVLVLANWQTVQERTLGFAVLFGIAALIVVVALRDSRLLSGLVAVAIAVIGIAPAVQLVTAVFQIGTSNVQLHARPAATSPTGSAEDVIIVVLDEYAGVPFLEGYGYDPVDFVQELRSLGMTVPEASWSSATTTFVSISEMLELAPVLPDGVTPVPADFMDLYGVMSGDNRVGDSLKAAGFRYTHIESGWEGTRCGDAVDRCVSAPWLDSTAWELWHQSVLGSALESRIGHPYTYAALSASRSLVDVVGEAVANGEMDFVFAHLLLPHGPYLLDEECRFHSTARHRSLPDDVAYLEQVKCAERVVGEVAALADDSTALVVTADHGRPTIERALGPAEWSDLAVAERLSVFLAHRFPEECAAPTDSVSTLAVAALLRCAVDLDIGEHQVTFTAALNQLPGEEAQAVHRLGAGRISSLREESVPVELGDLLSTQ